MMARLAPQIADSRAAFALIRRRAAEWKIDPDRIGMVGFSAGAMLTLALMGDVMLGRGVDAALRHMRPQDMWGDVLPHLLQADLRIANLECTLTRHAQPWTRSWKMFHFRADPGAARFLQAAHIDACSLANNHTLDFEARGLMDTLHALDSAGIRHAGAGLNAREAAAPALIEVPGTSPCRVALIAFTDNQPDFAAADQNPGTNFLQISLQPDALARVADAIARARSQGADWVVFSNHWGANFVERPAADFRRFARRVAALPHPAGRGVFAGQHLLPRRPVRLAALHADGELHRHAPLLAPLRPASTLGHRRCREASTNRITLP